jgi:hypothetical protein
MTSKDQIKRACSLSIILLIVGILCYSYTAFSSTPTTPPVRMMFKVVAGNVLFQHKVHTGPMGYGLACLDCHHHPEDEESDYRACGDCHTNNENMETVMETCTECHDPEDFDLEDVATRADAFHGQCAGCHEAFDSGPVADDCNACHVR